MSLRHLFMPRLMLKPLLSRNQQPSQVQSFKGQFQSHPASSRPTFPAAPELATLPPASQCPWYCHCAIF